MSIVGIYVQSDEYYTKCFKLKLQSLESNKIFGHHYTAKLRQIIGTYFLKHICLTILVISIILKCI